MPEPARLFPRQGDAHWMERGTKAMQLGSVHHALVCVLESSVDLPSVVVGVERRASRDESELPVDWKRELHEGRLRKCCNGTGIVIWQ